MCRWYRPGPPLVPVRVVDAVRKVLGFVPLTMWGRFGTPVPHKVGTAPCESCRHAYCCRTSKSFGPIACEHGYRCRALLTRAVCWCHSLSPRSSAGTKLLLLVAYATTWLRLICTRRCFLIEAFVTSILQTGVVPASQCHAHAMCHQ